VKITGKVWRYGDDFNTDAIIPARYLYTADPQELALHCMEDVDSSFVSAVRPGDIILAGKNYGCGSSREHAPMALKAIGIGCVVAGSFARIFYRNAINIGLAIMECDVCAESGDRLEIDFDSGSIKNLRTGQVFQARPLPPFMQELLGAGGLMEYVKSRRARHATNG
jgi:3-isopropylmalate/(R)-2-methylmalate dehydratase small subunit